MHTFASYENGELIYFYILEAIIEHTIVSGTEVPIKMGKALLLSAVAIIKFVV